MTLCDAVKEWLQYEPFEYLIDFDDIFQSITIRRRGLEKYDSDFSAAKPDEFVTYTGVVVGSINEKHNWVRIRGRYFYPHDPSFFNQLERELADACVNPEKGWNDDPH